MSNYKNEIMAYVEKNEVEFIQKKKLVENSIKSDCDITILVNGKQQRISPYKLIYIEDDLALVFQSHNKKCLETIEMREIQNILACEKQERFFNNIDIENFILGIRDIYESDYRLILKSKEPRNFTQTPKHHFYAHPCLLQNIRGDFIWAASVEMHDDIFEWLLSLGQGVEVLEPMIFKQGFLDYCERKLKKIA